MITQNLGFPDVEPNLVEQLYQMCSASPLLLKAGPRSEYYLYRPKLSAFLFARNKDIDAAFKMWCGWLEWREENKPFETTFDQVRKEYYSGKIQLLGRDRNGNICLVFKARRHHPKETNNEESVKMIFYFLEKLEERSINEGRFQIVFINDREGVGMSNVDYSFMGMAKDLISKFQNYYPEKVLRIFVLHPNFLFKTLFAVIKPFLNARTSEKIKIVNKLNELDQYFDKDNLTIEAGGNVPDPFIDYSTKKDIKGYPSPKFDNIFYMIDGGAALALGHNKAPQIPQFPGVPYFDSQMPGLNGMQQILPQQQSYGGILQEGGTEYPDAPPPAPLYPTINPQASHNPCFQGGQSGVNGPQLF